MDGGRNGGTARSDRQLLKLASCLKRDPHHRTSKESSKLARTSRVGDRFRVRTATRRRYFCGHQGKNERETITRDIGHPVQMFRAYLKSLLQIGVILEPILVVLFLRLLLETRWCLEAFERDAGQGAYISKFVPGCLCSTEMRSLGRS